MELSPEDSLRLNVMLANAIAVRIDEGTNLVYCLSDSGSEARIALNPNCRPDQYIRNVRELLSSHVMGSPGGYPVYLKRWTRMGQASDSRLDDLLLLGEPEAVVAVSGAPGLTEELARRTWWAMPDAENARRMLARECVVKSDMGRVLAEFLLEFLPFEESPSDIIESVRLVLQSDLISDEERMDIWNRGLKKNVFQVGFLHAQADNLPDSLAVHPLHCDVEVKLNLLTDDGNVFAGLLLKLLSEKGQSFISVCQKILKRPSNQDVVVSFLEAIEVYFQSARLSSFHYDSMTSIIEQVDKLFTDNEDEMKSNEQLQLLHEAVPELDKEIRAMLILAHTGEPVIRPIFAISDSVGTVMRKKIEPVSSPVSEQLNILQGK